jgi:uncharacterized membrane protein (UPF0136 family)
MKRLFTLLSVVSISIMVTAQTPEKMSYQSVIRNSSGILLANNNVGIKISILKDSSEGDAVYVETHDEETNANGLVTLLIGGGTVLTGTFAGIDWSAGSYFLKTETDPTGGSNYTISGTSQLLSVPYALFAKRVAQVRTGPTFIPVTIILLGGLGSPLEVELPTTIPSGATSVIGVVEFFNKWHVDFYGSCYIEAYYGEKTENEKIRLETPKEETNNSNYYRQSGPFRLQMIIPITNGNKLYVKHLGVKQIEINGYY